MEAQTKSCDSDLSVIQSEHHSFAFSLEAARCAQLQLLCTARKVQNTLTQFLVSLGLGGGCFGRQLEAFRKDCCRNINGLMPITFPASDTVRNQVRRERL